MLASWPEPCCLRLWCVSGARLPPGETAVRDDRSSSRSLEYLQMSESSLQIILGRMLQVTSQEAAHHVPGSTRWNLLRDLAASCRASIAAPAGLQLTWCYFTRACSLGETYSLKNGAIRVTDCTPSGFVWREPLTNQTRPSIPSPACIASRCGWAELYS